MGKESKELAGVQRLLSWFLPGNMDSFELEHSHKAQLLVWMSLFLLVSFSILSVGSYWWFEGRRFIWHLMILRVLLLVTLFINLLVFRRTGRLRRAGVVLLVSFGVVITVATLSGGGINSSAVFILLVLPVFSTFFLDARWGWGVTAFVLVYLAFLHLSFVQELKPVLAMDSPSSRVHIFCILLFLTMGVLWLFARNEELSREALRESYERNVELLSSRDQALHESQAKSEFLANMSHELRTPLNAIIGYAEILAEDAEEEELEEYVQDLSKIRQAGHHLLNLINDILDLSKIEAGHITLSYEMIELAPFLEGLADEVRLLVEKNGSNLELALKGAPTIHTDPRRLRQIVLNLLGNAAKFTEEGTVTLGTCVVEDEQGQQWLKCSVQDTGIGMTPEALEKVFQKFTQADSSMTRRYSGTGLGLTIVKELCELMGGNVEAESTPGEGSTFTVVLPVDSPHAMFQMAPQAGALFARSTSSQELDAVPSNKTLALVIDDEQVVLDLLSRLLQEEGYEVVTTSVSREALGIARQIKPDLITLDVMMEGLDGWSLLSQFKSDPELEATPVLMVTIVDEREKGFGLGASEYITKPFSRDGLRRILSKYKKTALEGSVLIVEDDPDTRDIAASMLAKEGWQITEANNGRDALALLDDISPDVILLDLMMPELDGFGFLKELRKHEDAQRQALPVVIFTAKELTPNERQWLQTQTERIFIKADILDDVSAFQKLRRALRPYLREKPNG